jgi:hypothetical protein
MSHDWSHRVAAIAAVATSGWLFTTGGGAIALTGASIVAGRSPHRAPMSLALQVGLGLAVLAAAFTVARAVPRMWTHRPYRRRTIAVIALVTTVLAALGILVTEQPGLIAVVVPSVTLLSLTSKTPVPPPIVT